MRWTRRWRPGRTVLAGGGHAEGPSYQPTILADVPGRGPDPLARRRSARSWSSQAVDDAEEAVQDRQRHARTGCRPGIITSDKQRGFNLARRIDAGMVHVNGPTIADEPPAADGRRQGQRLGPVGPQSMTDFTELQWITTRDGTGPYPI